MDILLDERGEPVDKSYLEANLPIELRESIEMLDNVTSKLRLDLYQCNLNADIGVAVVCNEISDECAEYLRKKYLSPKYVPKAMREEV